jgi:hypothetical protein
VIACIGLVIYFFHNKKNTNQELIGTYVNNYNELTSMFIFPPEAPRQIDTLILLKNGKFTSGEFGKGSYSIDTISGSLYVHLSYQYGYEKTAGFGLLVKSNSLFNRTPILIINSDDNYYYKKIK